MTFVTHLLNVHLQSIVYTALKIYCFEARDKKISLPVDRPTDRTTLKIHSILGNAMGSKKCDYPTLFGTILSVFSQEAVIIVRFSFLPPLLLPPFERQHKESIVKMHFLQIISN